MRKIQDIASFLFVGAVALLSFIIVLGVWDFFERDVIYKSFQTIGLLAVVAVVVMVAGKFIDNRAQVGLATDSILPNPVFKTIRHITVVFLIVSASLLAFLGVLAIWDVITVKSVLYKTISSVSVFAFASFLIIMTCLARENKLSRYGNHGGYFLGVVLVFIFLLALFAYRFLSIPIFY